jgi:hypothetical protein
VQIKEMTGIYTNPSIVQLVYALAGHEVVVRTVDQKIFKGVLEGVSPDVSSFTRLKASKF